MYQAELGQELQPDLLANVRAENATHGDLLRVDTAEGATRCWRKVILWYRYALRAWPKVQYLGVADDDVYIALARLAFDLKSLSAAGHRRVYWGQPMWMGYWNETRFEGEAFGGTSPEFDEAALQQFMDVRRLRKPDGSPRHNTTGLDLSRRGVGSCAAHDSRSGAWIGREVASGPFFFANTDLAIFGSDLARRVVEGRCLANFGRSLRRAEASGTFRRRHTYPCEPNIDQLLGWLVAHAARNVTYVQAQFHTQGFPWLTIRHNRPTASSIYIHKLGSDLWNWRYVDMLLSREGPYMAKQRECRPCFDRDRPDTSWVSARNPSAHTYSRWSCCVTLPRRDGGSGDSLSRCTLERARAKAALAAAARQRKGSSNKAKALAEGSSNKAKVLAEAKALAEARGPAESVRMGGASLPLVDGYCAPTDDTDRMQHGNRSCARVGDRKALGYWKLMHRPHAPWTIEDCVRRCRACAACHYVSFSESHYQRECSWYASCPGYASGHLPRIASELCPTFSTVRVPRPSSSS